MKRIGTTIKHSPILLFEIGALTNLNGKSSTNGNSMFPCTLDMQRSIVASFKHTSRIGVTVDQGTLHTNYCGLRSWTLDVISSQISGISITSVYKISASNCRCQTSGVLRHIFS
jgi:hypothetical protein